ncbi:hypothetical protein PR048_011654 [Dryococelus australis]|uniref:Retrovirus-related Pol polyprotein from transposon TNT 1-94 n=1 Tax=Dryococelus australis TaxID=614101 RepID=A0ABQ9HMH6_9NEOP|nr:hypothetical protein PR048_011654 [Dryococelus australis]
MPGHDPLSCIFERKNILSKLYVIHDLEEMGSKMDKSDKVCILLLTMPSSYDTIVTALETITNTLTIDFVKSRLLDAELKMKNKNIVKSDSECSFSARDNTNHYGGLGHFISNCPSRNSAPSRERGRGKFHKRSYSHIRPSYNSQEQGQVNSCDTDQTNLIVDSGATEHLVQKSL